jgi:hypothetical protein
VDAPSAAFVRTLRVSAVGETRGTTRYTALATLGTALLLATMGCTAGDSSPTPTPTATATEGASDAAILAAAIDAYTRYSAAFDVVLSKPPAEADYSQLRETVTPRYWSVLDQEFRSNDRTWTQIGSTAFGEMSLLDSTTSASRVTASVTVCVDSTHVKLVDASGSEVHAEERSRRFSMEVAFEGASVDRLAVDDAFSMEGSAECGA